MEDQDKYIEDVPLYPSIPTEKYMAIKPSKLLISVLVVLAIVLAINILAIVYLANDSLNQGQVIVAEKWDFINRIKKPVNYLVLGDSTANQGFDPAIVDEVLDLYGLNLATIGDFGFVDDVWLLETYIALHGVPETIIVIHSYDTPQRDVPIINLLETYSIPLSNLLDYAHISDRLSIIDVIQIYQSRLFPLYYRRATLDRVIARFREQGFEIFEQPDLFNDYGFMPVTSGKADDIVQEAALVEQLIDSGDLNADFSQSNIDAINQMIELAEEYGFVLYFVNGPTYEDLENNADFQILRENLHEMYETIAEKSPNVQYIHKTFSYPAESMVSPDHILASSADDYTRQLMSLIWHQ